MSCPQQISENKRQHVSKDGLGHGTTLPSSHIVLRAGLAFWGSQAVPKTEGALDTLGHEGAFTILRCGGSGQIDCRFHCSSLAGSKPGWIDRLFRNSVPVSAAEHHSVCDIAKS